MAWLQWFRCVCLPSRVPTVFRVPQCSLRSSGPSDCSNGKCLLGGGSDLVCVNVVLDSQQRCRKPLLSDTCITVVDLHGLNDAGFWLVLAGDVDADVDGNCDYVVAEVVVDVVDVGDDGDDVRWCLVVYGDVWCVMLYDDVDSMMYDDGWWWMLMGDGRWLSDAWWASDDMMMTMAWWLDGGDLCRWGDMAILYIGIVVWWRCCWWWWRRRRWWLWCLQGVYRHIWEIILKATDIWPKRLQPSYRHAQAIYRHPKDSWWWCFWRLQLLWLRWQTRTTPIHKNTATYTNKRTINTEIQDIWCSCCCWRCLSLWS